MPYLSGRGALKRKPGESEHDIQRTILDYLDRKFIFHYRQNTGAFKKGEHYVKFGTPGAPDIIAVIKGQYVGIEVKASGGEQSQVQFHFQMHLEAAGGAYILAYSLEDVTRVLES